MLKTPLHLAILAAPCLILPAAGHAQTKDNSRPTANQSAQPAIGAAEFARRAALGNMFEIESSTVASRQSQAADVKQFAQRMIKDHSQTAERLKSIASTLKLPTELDEPRAKTLQVLKSAQGPAFDRRFVQAQLDAHQDAVDLYDDYARSGTDATLKQFAGDVLPTLRQHLQMAEKLQSTLPPDRVGAGDAGSPNGRPAGEAQPGSRIVVQQTAPHITVDQGSPQVTVRQAQPDVTVRQPRPQITIRQPQPTVTIDMPQPEIVVRMPQPDVNVAMGQPQVQVQQPQPRVQVVQPQRQAQVDVQRDQPQVRVVQPQGSPDVTVQRADGQPEVRYERAQPKVVVNQPEGQPRVSFEPAGDGADKEPASTGAGEQASATAGTRDQQHGSQVGSPAQVGAQPARTAQAQAEQPAKAEDSTVGLRDRINAGDTSVTGTVASNAVPTRAMTVQRLEDMEVYNAKGEELGEVDRVIVDGKGAKFLVVGNGGFLGIGRDRVAFPMDRFWIRGDRLVIRGVTENDIEAMDDYRDQFDTMRRLTATDQAKLRLWQ
jgi:predicted outer membrane protein/sporulation protein YlmC with PRC-barrel domain